jgi:choline dehydrogenase-like flavoprotein
LIVDLERAGSVPSGLFDVCVVGAGAAGIVLAVELARKGKRVLLLEAGGARHERRSQTHYASESVGLPYSGHREARARVLGGTTTLWGGQILEIDAHVFRRRDWIEGSGWPFEKDVLAPYYKRAAEHEGLAKVPADASEIWHRLGVEAPDFGDALVSAFSRWCPVQNLADIHASTLRMHPSLVTCLHANAVELQLGDNSLIANSIRCRTLSGKEAIFEADAFVLCMGGIENSRFLLQPREDGSQPPWNRRGSVGKHYQDHVVTTAGEGFEISPAHARSFFDYVSVDGMRFHPKVKLSAAAQEENQTLDVCGAVAFVTGADRDDLAFAFETYRFLKTRRLELVSLGRLLHFLRNLPELAWHKVPYDRLVRRKSKTRLKLRPHCEQTPLSRGEVSLGTARDVLGLLTARVAWQTSDLELHSIRTYTKLFGEALQAHGIGRLEIDESLSADAGMIARIEENRHHIGGTRMADDESRGVVNPDLKLYGTQNVYVCGSSVFPCAGFANPTHTIIALAIRLADHLAAA